MISSYVFIIYMVYVVWIVFFPDQCFKGLVIIIFRTPCVDFVYSMFQYLGWFDFLAIVCTTIIKAKQGWGCGSSNRGIARPWIQTPIPKNTPKSYNATITKKSYQPKCPLTDNYKKMWYTYTVEYYSAINRMKYCHLQ
jgi:hypothetical protein